MWLLPFEHYIFSTPMTVDEAKSRLQQQVGPKSSSAFPVRKADKPYLGTVEAGRFRIVPVVDYRNSFIPIVTGRVFVEKGRTYIRVSMQPHVLVLIFLAV